MNRNKSSSNIFSQNNNNNNNSSSNATGTAASGLSNQNQGSSSPVKMGQAIASQNNGAGSALATSQRSSSRLQSGDRKTLIRPQSAQSPSESINLRRKINTPGGRGSGGGSDFEQTNSDGGELTLMDTQKPFVMSDHQTIDDGLSLRKPKSNELSDLPSHSNQPGAQSTAGTATSNLNKAFNKTLKAEIIKQDSKQLDNSVSHNQSSGNLMPPPSALHATGSQLLDHLEVIDSDKDMKDASILKQKLATQLGVVFQRIRRINDTMIQNLIETFDQAVPDIIHLRFEHCGLNRKAILKLCDYLRLKHKLRSIGLVNVNIDEADNKRLFEAISKSQSIRQIVINGNNYHDVQLSEAITKLLQDTRFLQEIDMSECQFKNATLFKVFIDNVSNGRANKLTMKRTQFGKFEQLIMQIIFTQSKSLRYLDLSGCLGSQEHFHFLTHLNQMISIQTLILDEIAIDLSIHMPEFGKVIGKNFRLQHLSMKDHNKVKQPVQIDFWKNLMPNRSLMVIKMDNNRIGDKTMAAIAEYLEQEGIKLSELHLNHNRIAAEGLIELSRALRINTSLKELYLGHNFIEDPGLEEFQQALSENDTLQILSLENNRIDNMGMFKLAKFLPNNTTLHTLDLSKNAFGSSGMQEFAKLLSQNKGLLNLYLRKNREITEGEEGIKELCKCINKNQYLRNLDMEAVKISRPTLRDHLVPALRNNIFIQVINAKIPKEYIEEHLEDNTDIDLKIISQGFLKKEGTKLRIDMDFLRPAFIVRPTVKLIRCLNIAEVELKNMDLTDQQIELVADHLQTNPPMRKLNISYNVYVTDYGMVRLAQSLVTNSTLEELTFLNCTNITKKSLEMLTGLVKNINITLHKITLDENQPSFESNKNARALTDQAVINLPILKYLNPNKKGPEVKFNSDADIASNFPSALKCWRIMKPSLIDVCQKQLQDPHIKQLADLLTKKLNMIEQLTLRQNDIGDEGANALAEFIKINPQNFQYLEISRNQITEKGARKIMDALRFNTRIKTLLIEYGNNIDDSNLLKEIQDEVFANNLICTEVKKSLDPDNENFGKLRITDKGPTYLRCAVKSVLLFPLVVLNLSDNLLGFKQAEVLASMIAANRPLKILNLSKNKFDVRAARKFSEAIKLNGNLHSLDLSFNAIKDEGIAQMILPIAKQAMRRTLINNLPPLEAAVIEKKSRKLIEMKIMMLNLTENQHKDESLKHVLALLFADKNIVIDIDPPKSDSIKDNVTGVNDTAAEDKNKDVNTSNQNMKDSPVKVRQQELVGRFGDKLGYTSIIASPRKLIHSFQLVPTVDFAKQEEKEREEKEKAEAAAAAAKKSKRKGGLAARGRALKKKKRDQVQPENSPDKNGVDADGNQVSDLEAANRDQQLQLLIDEQERTRCCWRCRRSCYKRQLEQKKAKTRFFLLLLWDKYKEDRDYARLFKCNEKILTEVENVSQRYITFGLYASIIFFYFTALMIPLTSTGDSCANGHEINVFFYYGIYAVLSVLMELGLSFYLQRTVKDPDLFKINKFHLWKIVGGQLARADFFTDVLFLTQMYSCGYIGIVIVGIITLCMASFYQFFMLFRLMKTDDNNLLRNIERNCKLAYVTEHHSLAVILDSFSLSNFESIKGHTITVPKIISNIKSYVEDLPQFIIQVVYILAYSDKKNDQTGVVVSILLGLFSFGMSISHALSAKASTIEVDKVMAFKEQRKAEMTDSNERKIRNSQFTQLNELQERHKELQDTRLKAIEQDKQSTHIESFVAELDGLLHKRSRLNKDAIPVSGKDNRVMLASGAPQQTKKSMAQVFSSTSPTKGGKFGFFGEGDTKDEGDNLHKNNNLNNNSHLVAGGDTSTTNLLNAGQQSLLSPKMKKTSTKPSSAASLSGGEELAAKPQKRDVTSRENLLSTQFSVLNKMMPTQQPNQQ